MADTSMTSSRRLGEILSVLRTHHITKGLTPDKLRKILEDLGPTYAKLGQVMSMRSDMLPESYCKELSKLQAEVKPLPFPTILEVVEKELHGPISRYFTSIDEKPVGSASIAQVHPAVLLDGSRVVIKVQRPGIHQTMKEDIHLMRKAAKLLKVAMGTGDLIDFGGLLDELWKISEEEMDFVKESHNYQIFADYQTDIVYVTCPQVVPSLCTPELIVMTYIDGTPIDQIHTLTEDGYNLSEIGQKIAENYCKQVLDDGFFHADPHPGNLWISGGQIVWLDMGMMGEISDHIRILMKKAILSIVKNDIYTLKNVILALGEPQARINHSRLYSDISEIINKYISMDLGSMRVGELIGKLLDLVKVHQIAMPTDITLLGRGIMTMEGLLACCSPGVNFLEIMSNHMSASILHNLDWQNELKHGARAVYSLYHQSMEIPVKLSELLELAKNGHLKVNLDITDSQEPLRQLTSMANHVVLGLITSALFLGSSILCTADLSPKFLGMPVAACFGYGMGLMTFLYLLYRTLKKRRKP